MKIVMALSGGMDSTTLLGHLLHENHQVTCVGFTYGSKHNKYENECAYKVAQHYRVPFVLISLASAMGGFKSDLLMSGGEIPEGHYQAENMRRTVVPGRNTIFLSFLAGIAESEGADRIAIGIHQGDHAIYPDCRQEYYKAMDLAIYLATDRKVQIDAPFLNTDKTGILKRGTILNVPYHLTRTCYKDQLVSCGKCGSCQERLAAFYEIGVEDPVSYEHRTIVPSLL